MILTSPSRDDFATGAAFDPETFRFFQENQDPEHPEEVEEDIDADSAEEAKLKSCWSDTVRSLHASRETTTYRLVFMSSLQTCTCRYYHTPADVT
ncbi:unnamed protein product [Cladocopium goreaui]|uniref:Uncharacterized protein n=1 Tax=Cladocopium goreaui TaxID=2562237 RepID=A0A9P1FW82_9DINO|nr:unnamed protein product [Cladocopium goreaui]